MAPSPQKLSAQWMSVEETETETQKLIRKSKQQPFIPIGIAGTLMACVWGAVAYKNRGPMSTSRYLMRLRVIAQSCVVGAVMVGVGATALENFLSDHAKKQ